MDFRSMLNHINQLSEATKETSTGRVHKADPGGYGRKFDTDDEGDEKKAEKKDDAPKKRGRPPKTGEHSPEERAKAEKREKAGKELQSMIVGNVPKKSKDLEKMPKTKHSLKEWIKQVEDKVIAEQNTQPLALLDPQNKSAGTAILKSTDPDVQKMLQGLDPKKVQVVMAQSAAKPATPSPATGMQPAAKPGQPAQPMQEEDTDYSAKKARAGKDIGKPGKQFAKIAKSAAEKYGSKERGEKVAGAVLAKLRKTNEGEIPHESGVDNIGAGLGAGRSKTTLEAKEDKKAMKKDHKAEEKGKKVTKDMEKIKESDEMGAVKDTKGSVLMKHKTSGKEMNVVNSPEVIKQHEDRGYEKVPTMKKEDVEKIKEAAKPDFLDLDKDGNKKESMKKAAADKKKKVNESMHKHSAAKLMGKAHALAKEGYNCKYDDMEEARMYHEGYKEGLDECYGKGVYEQSEPMEMSMPAPTMEADMEEGNAFTAALAKAKKGEKFSVGGKTFTDRTNYDAKVDEMTFENWDKELNELLIEGEQVSEGMSVSISKGNQHAPDSVTVSAQDAEADALLGLIKQAGLGLFADKEGSDYGAPQSDMAQHGGVNVVGDHDGMMSLIKKVTGQDSEHSHDSHDYKDEEDAEMHGDRHEDEPCNECGMNEGMHETHCSKREMVDEVESEDQMGFEATESQMYEDNPPDSDEAETTADEDAEAAEDLNKPAFGGATNESELNEWANQVGKGPGKGTDASFEQDIEFMTKFIAGGLNKPKSTGQTTIPVIAGQDSRMEDPLAYAKLAGIKK